MNEGWTCPYIAVHYGVLPIVKIVLENGANIEGSDTEGKSSLNTATEKGRLSIVKILLERDANIKGSDTGVRTSSHLAASRGSLAIVGMLLEHGAKSCPRTKPIASWD